MGRVRTVHTGRRASRLIDIQVALSLFPQRGDGTASMTLHLNTDRDPLREARGPAGWDRYVPGPDDPWDLARVVGLHRRAGFAATWRELQRDLSSGPDASIDRLLSGTARGEGVPTDFAAIADKLVGLVPRISAGARRGGSTAWSRGPIRWASGWRCSGMTTSPPARAKLGHWSAGRTKSSASSPALYGELLKRVVHDPALLVWLDANENTRGRPNRDLGELMELFTIGVGNYTETDVKEAARVRPAGPSKTGD